MESRQQKLSAVAEYYQVSPQTIRIMAQRGLIPGIHAIKSNRNYQYVYEPELLERIRNEKQ